MQILALAVYQAAGRRRDIAFQPGRVNILTGESKTGKSALLDMVEYCLGRDSIMMPVGPITSAVVWYAALFQMPGGSRAFVARPAPREGAASTQQAMLEFGGPDLNLLPLERIGVNCDTRSLREQLGRRIGIEENLTDPGEFSLRAPLEANLGHATLLCLQGQDEIANRNYLFHRQAEAGIEQALKDALPYFLGAVPRDQALKRSQLRDAKRDLTRIRNQVAMAEAAALAADSQLRALVDEAVAVGLMDPLPADAERTVILATLDLAVSRQSDEVSEVPPETDRRVELEMRRRRLRDELRAVTAERRLLLEAGAEEGAYSAALNTQAARLTSLDLIPSGSDDEADMCPLCSSALREPDPRPAELRQSLTDLRNQLSGLEAARPTRRAAVATLDQRAAELRGALRGAEEAARAVTQGDEISGAPGTRDRVEFTRGRLSAMVSILQRADDSEIQRLNQLASGLDRRVSSLETELDDDESAMRLDSHLIEVSTDMTQQAQRLSLEHSGSLRLDLGKLTVITETSQGPAPLRRVGSAENWIGAHLVAHLALHRFFARHDRPVPRFLILDQPTQAWYPSEVEEWDGVPIEDSDREAVRAVFQLLLEVVAELAPNLQVIVCDHANLPEDWFQETVEHNWRGGEKLVPADWLEPDDQAPS